MHGEHVLAARSFLLWGRPLTSAARHHHDSRLLLVLLLVPTKPAWTLCARGRLDICHAVIVT